MNEQGNESLQTQEQGFSSKKALQQAEHAAIQVAATAKAEVESSFIIAQKAPRNQSQSRAEILDACKNRKFAEKVLYSKPVGGGKFITGASIRFAEEAIRAWGNVMIQHYTIYEDGEKRISMVKVIDLQKNLSYTKQMVIEKAVERKNSIGREVISDRLNSYKEKVFLVVATDDELRNKEAAMLSKEIRNATLRIIPQDIVDEAIDTARLTLLADAAVDPQAEKKKILDSFSNIGVKPIELEKYLKCKIDTISPAQIVDLRAVYTSIKDGQTTWAQVVEGTNGKELTAPQQKKVPRATKPAPEKTPPKKKLAGDLVKHFIGEVEKCKIEADLDQLAEEIKPEIVNLSKAEKAQLDKAFVATREKIQKK